MASNGVVIVESNISDPDMQKLTHEGLLCNSEDDVGLQNALKVSSEVDTNLAYLSEKLVNLENLLLQVLAGENDIGAFDFENDNISEEFIDKAFTFDLLYAMLNFEVRDLDNLLADLQDLIIDALRKISSSQNSTELLISKLHDSEDLLKQSQDRILEMKIQLAKLQMTSFVFKQNEYKHSLDVGARTEWKNVEQRRVLRMLEVSLARELELEKKLAHLKQNEDDLKLKIRLTEQIATCMEEAAEVAWGRFLEADNTAAVLMGVSKEIMGNLQTVNLCLSSTTKREGELKSNLQDCVNRLNEKEISIHKLSDRVTQLVADNAEVTSLRERVQVLEENLRKTESELVEANASNQSSQQQLKITVAELESLRGDMHAVESRATGAEEKVSHLTESNLEMTEEIDYLKGINDSSTKKVTALEKQLRELDIQLQHSKAFSESGQEQQNMLYTAIWDMETLIDELKQKVADADSKTESAEEQCSLLSKTNSELNKEVEFLKSKMEVMEKSINEYALQKQLSIKDIGARTDLIMDMVMQLALERQRIQKQLASLSKENKLLRQTLEKEQCNASIITQVNRSQGHKKSTPLRIDSSDTECANTTAAEEATDNSPEIFQQVEKSLMDASLDGSPTSSSSSGNLSTNAILKLETESLVQTSRSRGAYTFVSILVLLLSILAACLLHKRYSVFQFIDG